MALEMSAVLFWWRWTEEFSECLVDESLSSCHCDVIAVPARGPSHGSVPRVLTARRLTQYGLFITAPILDQSAPICDAGLSSAGRAAPPQQ